MSLVSHPNTQQEHQVTHPNEVLDEIARQARNEQAMQDDKELGEMEERVKILEQENQTLKQKCEEQVKCLRKIATSNPNQRAAYAIRISQECLGWNKSHAKPE